MEDISVAADVAVRTIYLHFDSKAAVLLTGFDDWLDDFYTNRKGSGKKSTQSSGSGRRAAGA